MFRSGAYLLKLALPLLLMACASLPTPQARRAQAEQLAAGQGWRPEILRAGPFELMVFSPPHMPASDDLTVFIEGDGFAWVTADTPSPDPTPRDPLALRLALAHPAANAVYLGRPCQYGDAQASGCARRYWTEARFANEVIEATATALDQLKARHSARRLVLVAYSGGGAVAALAAARRNDVARLVTVAGNLDHAAWTMHHRISPLAGSLNAADVAARLSTIPQTHFVGGRDRVIPPALAAQWPRALAGEGQRNLKVVPEADHACCWAERWPVLWHAHLETH